MMHEAQMHRVNSFVTLTYDQVHLPVDRSLDVRHFQLFMKRLRKARSPQKIRFYHCGEYGPQTLRPHYHAALFGCDFPDQVEVDGGSKSGEQMWSSAELTSIWGKGLTTVQPLTFETAAYVAGYIIGKAQGLEASRRALERVDPVTGETWEVAPEYSTMSRRPGIGSRWLEEYQDDVYPHDFVVRSGGAKLAPPKFYDKKIDEDLLAELKERRAERGRERRMTHETPARRKAREEIVRARKAMSTRDVV